MRPMALSRFVSSKSSSVSERSLPRSPRKASSVRGRRPSPSAKFWRRSWSRAVAAFALASSVWRRRTANSARTASTFTVTPASMRAVMPILRARSTRPARSSAGRSATKAARLASTRTRRSTTTRSRSTETRVLEAGAGALAGVATGGRLVAAEPGTGRRPAGEGRLTTLAGASMPRTLWDGGAS